jgi:hypothetical protein
MFLGFLGALCKANNIQFIELFACHELLTSAQCAAIAVEVGSLLTNCLIQIFFPIDGIKCDTLIVCAPWYACNSNIHRDLGIRMVTAEIKRKAKKQEDRLHQHTNMEAIQLIDNERREGSRLSSFLN